MTAADLSRLGPLAGGPAAPGARLPLRPADQRVAEFRPDGAALPRFFVWTLGCQMNRSDSEEMAGRLRAAGCHEAVALEDADLVVINTCAIREAAEAKVIGRQGALGRLKAARPGMRVVLAGCAVRERDRSGLSRRFPAIDLFLRPDEEPELVARLGLASAQAGVGLAPRTAATTVVNRVEVSAADLLPAARASAVAAGTVARASAVSAWLPIVYGCDKSCTYCIVPFSRGPERSRPFDEVVAEASALAAGGYREVTLLGQNVNSYGHDLLAEERFAHVAEGRRLGRRIERASRPDLAELIRAIDGLRGPGGPAIPRLRFVTSHPWDLSDRLIAAVAECSSACEALHLPVQSGDDTILQRMGRQYSVGHYRDLVRRVRAAVPGIAVSTDVIVGFCGETEAQFEATLDLLEELRFEQVFAAAYSPRPGTPAARLADDVPPAVKRERLNRLLARQEGISHERNRAWLGRTVEVLIDEAGPARMPGSADGGVGEAPAARPGPLPEGFDRLGGRTRHNKLVHLAGPATLVGSLVEVRIEHAGPYSLRGSLVP
jgi:tRNA-2-methylthio-N6-dimethylallyladenosine synthase